MRRVLHLVDGMFDGGGIPHSVWNMARGLRDFTTWQPIICAARYPGLKPLDSFESDHTIERHILPIWQPLNGRFGMAVAYPPGYNSLLRRLASTVDVVHIHGIWTFPTLVGCPIVRSIHKPYILAPRGSLEPWALSHKAPKKKIVLELVERHNLNRAACLQATSEPERDTFGRLRLTAPVVVVPNGLNRDAESFFRDGYHTITPISDQSRSATRTAIFASRLHPGKRVVELVWVFRRLVEDFPEWRLLIAGGEDVPGYERQVRNAVRDAELIDRVQLVGHLRGVDLWTALAAADLMVLPTLSENFGNIVVESLAAGLPVVTTKGAPWRELESNACGWWVGLDMNEFERALREAMGLAPSARRDMGQRGRQLVQRKYTLQMISQQLADVYDRILQP